MKKKLSIKLSIPMPCTENWENMSPNERGRHCASCNKTVIDFSLFSDRQLIEFFTKTAGNICGRLSKYQLEQQLVYSEPPKHPFFHKLLFGTALAAGITATANAQQSTTKPQTAKKTNTKIAKKKSITKDTNRIEILATTIQNIPIIEEKQAEYYVMGCIGSRTDFDTETISTEPIIDK